MHFLPTINYYHNYCYYHHKDEHSLHFNPFSAPVRLASNIFYLFLQPSVTPPTIFEHQKSNFRRLRCIFSILLILGGCLRLPVLEKCQVMYFKILHKWRLTRNKIYLRCIVVWEGVCYTVSFVRTLLLTSRSFDRMSPFWEWNENFTFCIKKYITFILLYA